MSIISQSVVRFLDSHVPDIDSLHNVASLIKELEKETSGYTKEKQELEQNLPKNIHSGIISAEEALSQLSHLHEQTTNTITILTSKEETTRNFRNKLSKLSDQISVLETARHYLLLVDKVESLSASVNDFLENHQKTAAGESGMEDIFSAFETLVKFRGALGGFRCDHLKRLTADRVDRLAYRLEGTLRAQYDAKLTALGWPTPLKDVALSDIAKKELLDQLAVTLRNLTRVQLLFLGKKFPEKISDFPRLWCVQSLLDPVGLRFRFHFRTNQKTNRMDKPEFFFSYVLGLMRDHQKFFEWIQNWLNRDQLGYYDVTVEFMKGLVAEISEKLKSDWPVMESYKLIIWKTVNETLAFVRTLRDVCNYPENYPTPLDFFSSKERFPIWLQLEVNYSQKHLSDVISDVKAWKPKYEDSAETDPLKPSYSVYELLRMCKSIQERYKLLPLISDRCIFLDEVQIPLLKEYGEIIEKKKGEILRTISGMNQDSLAEYCILINSANYCVNALQDWGDDLFYLTLYQHVKRTTPYSSSSSSEEAAAPSPPAPGSETPDPLGTVFDDTKKYYQSLSESMLDQLVEVVSLYFKNAVVQYQKKSFTEMSSLIVDDLSGEICNGLSVLKGILLITETNLSHGLFQTFWKNLASLLNEYFFVCVVCKQFFSYPGALQFEYDMKALFMLFKSYTLSPQNYFKDVKEACVLLTLSEESFNLIKVKINTFTKNKTNQSHRAKSGAIEFLKKFGIYKLDVGQVLKIINARLPK